MNKDPETPPPSGGQFLVYQTEDGKLKIDVRFEGETVWLTQQHMAELFRTTQQNISLHLRNIYAEGELQLEATHKESLSVRQEGARSVRRRVDFYNLDAIISVGYRVKSAVATRFRIWATRQLREYIVKGFLLDDERLKNPDQPFDYFDEQPERIPKERGRLARRSLRRRLGLAHSYKGNSSAPSALLGDLPARHSPRDGGGCAFAVKNSFLSHNRRVPNGWADPRNLTFFPPSPKAADPKEPHSDGRNVEMRNLSPFTH